MSTGGLIGGIVGGVVGFFIGGPVGAAIGAGIGAGLGMMIDPVQADAPTPGDPGTVTVNFAQEGSPLPDFLGSPKLNGNIIWAGEERVAEVKEEQQGGKGGGSQEVVTGHEYFLDWAVNFGRGPMDTLYTIYANEKIVWSGALDKPSSGGMVTLTLAGMGAADFYYGTADQSTNEYMTQKIAGQTTPAIPGGGWWGDILEAVIGASGEERDHLMSLLADATLNPAYRGQVYMVLKDCSLGNYNRAPSIFLVGKKTPSFSTQGISDSYKDVDTFDYNPSHALYYILNKMADIKTDYLHASDFNDMALKLKGESRGLSITFGTFREALSYIESITRHISGGVRWGVDSKIHPFLFRKTADVSGLTEINPEDLLGVPSLDRKTWLDTLNEMKVQYTKRIFRDITCPSGPDGLIIDDDDIESGEVRVLTIENVNWTAGECEDVSFMSDGLPPELAGAFYDLTDLGDGLWRMKYGASADLCDNQEDIDNPDCPEIGGVLLPCCSCESVDPFILDVLETPETIAPGGSAGLFLTGGLGPYTWDVVGVGYSLSEITSTPQNDMTVVSGTCGVHYAAYAAITVTDSCGSSVSFQIRNTGGQWGAIGQLIRRCGYTGPDCVSCFVFGCVPSGIHQDDCQAEGGQDIIEGYQRWGTFFNFGCVCESHRDNLVWCVTGVGIVDGDPEWTPSMWPTVLSSETLPHECDGGGYDGLCSADSATHWHWGCP